MFINAYFDQVYLINLDSRINRLEQADRELKNAKVDYLRVSGIVPTHIKLAYHRHFEKRGEKYTLGACGCKATHLKIIHNAKKKGYKRVLIIEDDIQVNKDANQVVENAVKQMNDNDCVWDMLYLGGRYPHGGFYEDGSRWFQEFVGMNVLKLKGAMTTLAYGIAENMYDFVLENALNSGFEIDIFYYRMHQHQKQFGYFGVIPPVINPTEEGSDIK